jgi:hypothetical protein
VRVLKIFGDRSPRDETSESQWLGWLTLPA